MGHFRKLFPIALSVETFVQNGHFRSLSSLLLSMEARRDTKISLHRIVTLASS